MEYCESNVETTDGGQMALLCCLAFSVLAQTTTLQGNDAANLSSNVEVMSS